MFSSIFISFSFLASFVLAYEVIPLTNSQKFLHPKSMHWDDSRQCLYFADRSATSGIVVRYDFCENKFYVANVVGESSVSFIIPRKNCKNQDEFVIGDSTGGKIMKWDGQSANATIIETAFKLPTPTNGMNTMRADIKGRLYGGTETPGLCNPSLPANASFFAVVKRKGIMPILQNIRDSNGVAWVVKDRKMYYLASCTFLIREYSWCPKTGALYNERIVFDIKTYANSQQPSFLPTGLSSDCEGKNLYVALMEGSGVLVISRSTWTVVEKIEIPTPATVDAVWGGPKRNILFVGSGTEGQNIYVSKALVSEAVGPLGGYIFMVKGLGVKGTRANNACV